MDIKQPKRLYIVKNPINELYTDEINYNIVKLYNDVIESHKQRL